MSEGPRTVTNEQKEVPRTGGSGVAMNHREGKYIASPEPLNSSLTEKLK
jgi:hypothetical protein